MSNYVKLCQIRSNNDNILKKLQIWINSHFFIKIRHVIYIRYIEIPIIDKNRIIGIHDQLQDIVRKI